MSIWGKIIGGAAGLALGGPIGAMLGATAGHAVDRFASADAPKDDKDEQAATKKIAFTIGVVVLSAKMAKADGVVTRDEIAAFREVFHIPPEEVRNVGRVWDMARRDVAGFEIYAQQIARLFNPGSPVLEELLLSLFHIAKADGVIHQNELAYLERLAEIFGFDETAFQRIRAVAGDKDAEDPYSVLGIAHDAEDAEVKRVYRTLIREHHPDRLIAEGLPEEFVAAATEKMAAINAAYDRITKQRGMS
ncbi:TerB family tellurite resistance protein [Nisaea acidiphila]|uniref:TerB family tellurite resistance protein n=1 Tax=Nisaea acidiphila TaxID=1862145 RepID=A0A9J7AVU6_9PROT|nr:TerB family tellurite resistance protein [Nisaea acidiphila]UUX51246.1 TerB family tellurite resistance protein [Nisaea acidiphila]